MAAPEGGQHGHEAKRDAVACSDESSGSVLPERMG